MVRPSTAQAGTGIDHDGTLPNSGSRAQGPTGISFGQKVKLLLLDGDYFDAVWRDGFGPSQLETLQRRLYANNAKYGTFYGFTNKERGKIYREVYKSTKGAVPLAHVVAEIAVLPFSGGLGLAGKIAGKICSNALLRRVVTSLLTETFKESTNLAAEILGDKTSVEKIDAKKRAKKFWLMRASIFCPGKSRRH
ncbi:MAG: hypothetical protein GXP17_08030 [Gammaproteobacteria bacterium]|nr:hypothetical protein [Gammaproteobacteria bacterium]